MSGRAGEPVVCLAGERDALHSPRSDARLRAFLAKCSERTAIVGVLGLGYVGLPLALRFAEAGFRTIGFDIDAAKVQALNEGRTYIKTVSAERVRANPI